MSYIVIVGMEQPESCKYVGLEADDNFSLAEFDSIADVKALKEKHMLGVFEWLVIGVRGTVELVELL